MSIRIDLVIVRDPDGGTSSELFVDGEPAGHVNEYVIDAGAGHEWADWREARDEALKLAAEAGPAVLSAVEDAYINPPGAEYIDGAPDYDDGSEAWLS